MASNIPFYRGQDCVLKLYQNGRNVYIPAKSWSVEENASEIQDGVNGENRDRLDKVTNFYSASCEIFQTDQSVMQMIIDAQTPDDNSALPLSQTAAIQIKHKDGTKAAYKLTECKFGPFSTGNTGRTEAIMLTLKIRFRYFEQVPTI